MMENQSDRAVLDPLQAFWQNYLEALGPAHAGPVAQPPAWSFGDSPSLAAELCQLVLEGIKTATCSLLWEYETGSEAVPEIGDWSIILDGNGYPRCIIETTAVTLQAFSQVEAAFAYEEGEGDRTLSWWREAHKRAFMRTCQAMGWSFSEDIPLVCERFRLVWKPPTS